MRWRLLILAALFHWIAPPWVSWASPAIVVLPWQVNVALTSGPELKIIDMPGRHLTRPDCEIARRKAVAEAVAFGGMVPVQGRVWRIYGTWCGLAGDQI